MQLQNFIIGLMAFILFSVVTLNLVFDVYNPDTGLNVSLNNSDTRALYTMQETVNNYQGDLTENREYMSDRVPGGPEAALDEGEMSEGQLAKTALTALTKIPTYLSIFSGMVISVFSSIGIGGEIFIWFFVGSIIVIIVLLLLGSVLRNKV